MQPATRLRRVAVKQNPAFGVGDHGMTYSIVLVHDVPALLIETSEVLQFDTELQQSVQLELQALAHGQRARLEGFAVSIDEVVTAGKDNGNTHGAFGEQDDFGTDTQTH